MPHQKKITAHNSIYDLSIANSLAKYSAFADFVSTFQILDCIPKDTKGRVLLYLHLESDPKIMNGKQALNGVCIQLLADAQLSIKHPQEPKQQLEGIAAVIMCQVFGLVDILCAY